MISKRRRRREREREKKRIMIFLLVDGKKLCIWCETQLVERLWRFIIPALWVLMAGPVVLPERKSGGARRDFSILLFSCPAHPPCFSMCTTRLVYGLINWISRVRVWAAADKHQKSRRLRVRRCVNADEWAGDFCFVFFFRVRSLQWSCWPFRHSDDDGEIALKKKKKKRTDTFLKEDGGRPNGTRLVGFPRVFRLGTSVRAPTGVSCVFFSI